MDLDKKIHAASALNPTSDVNTSTPGEHLDLKTSSSSTAAVAGSNCDSEASVLQPLLTKEEFKAPATRNHHHHKYQQSLPERLGRSPPLPSRHSTAAAYPASDIGGGGRYAPSERTFAAGGAVGGGGSVTSSPKIRPLNHNNSVLSFSKLPFVMINSGAAAGETGSQNMQPQGVDENIYHWKVLNLSRAKLKASSRTSALLSGFAMVAMVEIQIDEEVPLGLLITFAVCTVLLIAVHMLALMISTCVLPNVEAVANLHFQTQKTVFESPHSSMNFIIELAWGFSTVLGILLFLLEIAILCWVKFYKLSHVAAWVATGLLIPIMFIFIAFAAHFYVKLVAHKSEVMSENIRELEKIQQQLDETEKTDVNGGGGAPGSVQIV